jgi:putative transcriptional regulator
MPHKKRALFDELIDGVSAMRAHRKGKLTLRTHRLDAPPLPRVTAALVRDTRQRLNMSQRVFARKLRVNPRTLERREQGRSKPNDQAAALILLVRRFPDTVDRLDAIGSSRRSRPAAFGISGGAQRRPLHAVVRQHLPDSPGHYVPTYPRPWFST